MRTIAFDGELTGGDGARFGVHCEVESPLVGGQRARVRVSIPVRHLRKDPPRNPCVVAGGNGATKFHLTGVHWKRFPTVSNDGALGLAEVDLLHVDKLIESHPCSSKSDELRVHLAPIAFFRREASHLPLWNGAGCHRLFSLLLPGVGLTQFVVDQVTQYEHDADIPGAAVLLGFSAVLPLSIPNLNDVEQIVEKFKESLPTLSVLFRQAVTIHGWTFAGHGEHSSTWVHPLQPNSPSSAWDERGEFVARPQEFIECANKLTRAYAEAETGVKSLVRHLSAAVAPHIWMGAPERFMFMFKVFERVIEFAFRKDESACSATSSDAALIEALQRARNEVLDVGREHAASVADRLTGFVKLVGKASVQSKLDSLYRVYPGISGCTDDLWPIVGTERKRGLRDLRNALAHGRSASVPADVVAVATWHLGVLLERVIFVLLGQPLPEGIAPRSVLLSFAGRGWYERQWWEEVRTRPDRPV